MIMIVMIMTHRTQMTKDGVTTIAFSHSLSGHPEDPLYPPPAPTIAIIWQIERRRQRRREGFRVSICHEKFLLHLNQGAPPQ